MPKSREHGQGALYWVESRKMWRAVLDVGFDETTGKRLQKARMSKSKDEAVKKLNAMIRERDSLGMVMDRSTRVAELAEAWLADVADRAKPKTLTNYRSNVRTKVLPSLGRRVVSELTPADVRRMHAAIRATGAGYSSVASAHRTLVTMLEYAKSERVISGENVAMLAPPRRGRVGKAKDSFTREQAKALLQVEDARVTLGLLTGLRSGEAMALRWEDIDFDRAVAELSWSLTEASFEHGCGGTCEKIRAGNCPRRILEISDSLEAIPLEGRLVLVRPKNDTPRQIPLTPLRLNNCRSLGTSTRGRTRSAWSGTAPTGHPRPTPTTTTTSATSSTKPGSTNRRRPPTGSGTPTSPCPNTPASPGPPQPASQATAAPKPPTRTATSSPPKVAEPSPHSPPGSRTNCPDRHAVVPSTTRPVLGASVAGPGNCRHEMKAATTPSRSPTEA
ncbi:tyrosine-type recombinase/integrase [Microbacterium trichothecenolyticum]